MRKTLSLCFFSLMLAACSGETNAPAADAASAPAADLPVYRVASHLSYPPFHFLDEKGEPTGFEMDLLREVAKAGGFDVNITNTPRNNLERTLADGTVDIWSSTVSIKPDMLKTMDFSRPFLHHDIKAVAVLDNEQNQNLKTPQDLLGKKIAISKYSKSSVEPASKLAGSRANVVVSESYYAAMKEVYSGRADGALSNSYVLAYQAKQEPNIKVRQIIVEDQKKDYAFAVKKGDAELVKKLNAGLEKVKANGTFNQLLKKWFDMEAPADN